MSVSVKERRAQAVIRKVSSTNSVVEISFIRLETLQAEFERESRGWAETEVEINEYLADYQAESAKVLAKIIELNNALQNWKVYADDASNFAMFELGV
jgi:hypothetical protein